MEKNRIRGGPGQGERAKDREALVTKDPGNVNLAVVRRRIQLLLPGEISPCA